MNSIKNSIKNMQRLFYKYVIQNVFAMIGLSCYILADTFFISKAAGNNGITVLNLALPIYGIIFSIGSMIGVGSATRYAIAKQRKDELTDHYFANAIMWDLIIGLVFSMAGIFFPEKIMALMGADKNIIEAGIGYNRIFISFAPVFMMNYVFTNFVRNDNDSALVMCATITSSLSNVILDYILMFPVGMGINGAALATALSPLISIGICSVHFLKKKNTVRFKLRVPSLLLLFRACGLGVSAFVAEISSAVTTMVFNFILMNLYGNTAVASYGVVANFAMVAVAIFNGIAQGTQPLLSESYGKGNKSDVKMLLKRALMLALILALLIIGIVFINTGRFVDIFNSDGSAELEELAFTGLRLYFVGFIFAAGNIIISSFFGATEKVKPAFITSLLRGFVLNIACAFLLSKILGVTGVWLSFPTAEFITAVVSIILLFRKKEE